MKDNKKWGPGTFYYYKGSIFNGEYMNDYAHGYGELVHENKDVYLGFWKDGRANGKGSYAHSDGSRLEGEWVNDKIHG
jgi:hypothetical protein